MIQTTQIHVPIPKIRNTHVKVEINGVDMTSRVLDSNWVLPCTNGIGTFNVNISNSNGQYSSIYSVGDTVNFYADNSDASILQFTGRIDYIKDDISNSGQFLNIQGRHKSYLLNEFLICYSAEEKETSEILKEIIDKLSSDYGFTYSNINTSTSSMSVEWNYKPFWECIIEIANKAGFDCYVDNDLDFHYFKENSISNTDNAIVEGDNFISSQDLGTNNYYDKTRVVVMGQDKNGLPIIYTAISSNEDEIRELFIKETSLNTYEKVKSLAESKLLKIENRIIQIKTTSYGLDSISPGDNIWIIVPRQKLAGQYKIVNIKHKFGMKVGGWKTEVDFEEFSENISQNIQNLNTTTNQISNNQNVNKLNYSYNFDFLENVGTHTNTKIDIKKGVLKTDGSASGTWVSPIKTLDSNAKAVELRMSGEQTDNILVDFSLNGGTVWKSLKYISTSYTVPTGKSLRLKVELLSASARLSGLSLLYS